MVKLDAMFRLKQEILPPLNEVYCGFVDGTLGTVMWYHFIVLQNLSGHSLFFKAFTFIRGHLKTSRGQQHVLRFLLVGKELLRSLALPADLIFDLTLLFYTLKMKFHLSAILIRATTPIHGPRPFSQFWIFCNSAQLNHREFFDATKCSQ